MISGKGQSLDDVNRLKVLHDLKLLDTMPEESFDRFTRLAAGLLKIPVVLFSLVDSSRQFFKSQFGLPEPYVQTRQTDLSHSFCKHVVQSGDTLAINDSRETDLVRDNLAIAKLGVVAYLGVPVYSECNNILGSFCAIDSQPKVWSEEEISLMRDLALAMTAEIHLRSAQLHLEKTNLELLEEQRMRDNLIHMIVHDMRTPLTAYMGGLDLVKVSGPLNADQSEFIKISVDGGRQLMSMIDDLLDIHTYESGTLRLDLDPFDIAEHLRAVESQVRAIAHSRGQTLEIHAEQNLPTLIADRDKLTRVLVNLVANAIKFTPEKGRITLRAFLSSDQGLVTFEVEDNGPGIPPEQLDYIFEKFGRVPGAKGSQFRSTGLGLTFCKLAVQAHGGRIEVQSESGKGSTFKVLLHVGQASA